MKDPKAAVVIRTRLKYDWIVLLYGLLCVSIQLIFLGNLGNFLLLIGAFVYVEVFEVSVYRKLRNGGEEYHMLLSRILDQQTSVAALGFGIALEFVVLAMFSINFLVNIPWHGAI